MHFNENHKVIAMKKIKKKVNRRGDRLVCTRHRQFRLPEKELYVVVLHVMAAHVLS
jgi:hypothetical protein